MDERNGLCHCDSARDYIVDGMQIARMTSYAAFVMALLLKLYK